MQAYAENKGQIGNPQRPQEDKPVLWLYQQNADIPENESKAPKAHADGPGFRQ